MARAGEIRPSRVRLPELLDQRSLSLSETEQALHDLDRATRWLWGLPPVYRTLVPWLSKGPLELRLLDVGTGSGFVPSALVRKLQTLGIRTRCIGVDRKLSHLLFGRKAGYRLLPVVAEAAALPFRDACVHWSMSTLFCHHFDAAENRRILSQMQRTATKGTIAVDLRESRMGLLLLKLALPLLGAGSVARADGCLSLVQAWTIEELEILLADRQVTELRRRFPFRLSLVLLKPRQKAMPYLSRKSLNMEENSDKYQKRPRC